MLTLKLRTERLLNGTLRLGNREPVNCNRACLRERNLALAVNSQAETIIMATPQVDHNVVSRTKHIIGTDWEIHRQFVRIPRAEKKSVAAEAL
jgi:hypothetical protein